MDKVIYLDNAATTPLDERVLTAMTPYLTGIYGNANSVHSVGRKAVDGLDNARETVAGILGANFNEIYFTSGGTEGNNWALRGAFLERGSKNKLVISAIEHAAVLSTASELEKQGATVKKVGADKHGVVSYKSYVEAGLEDAFLVSLMYANNEIGSYQEIEKVASLAKENGALFFTDAVQAAGVTDINVKKLGVDMLSLSAHKFGGPKGVGVLYIKSGARVSPLITGGHQERAKRGGTSNVAGAVGLAKALELSRVNLVKNNENVASIRDYFVNRLLSEIDGAHVNGSNNKLVGNASVTFKGINGEALLYQLDLNGVCASLGAACSSGTIEPSYVLKEIGLSDEDARSTLRFSFGVQNTLEEASMAVEIIKKSVLALK